MTGRSWSFLIFLTFSGSAVFNGGNFSLSFCCLFGASWLLATPLTGELAISVVDLDLDLESRWKCADGMHFFKYSLLSV